MFTGRKHSEETKEKLRQANLKNPNRYWLGKTRSLEARKNLSIAHMGINTGEDHPLWKGEEANYYVKHGWMTRHYGQPRFCEGCGTEEAKSYHWANLSGNYIRDFEDWIRLCQSCHFKMDKVGYRSWATRRSRKESVDLY